MAANAAVEALRELLARPPERLPEDAVLVSGLPELDQALGGGFPRGAIVTLEGPPSSGAGAIIARLLGRATAAGFGALVQTRGCLSPLGLAAAGVLLERLAIIPVAESLGVVRAADILVRSGCFAVVAMPVPGPARGVGALVWNRLSGLVQRTGTILAVTGLDPPAGLRAAATIRLEVTLTRVHFRGPSGLFGELAGYELEASVRKDRRAAPGRQARVRCEPFEPRPKLGEDDRSGDFGPGTLARDLRG
jgi:hypothetical protein